MTIKEFLIETGNFPNLSGFNMLVRAVEIVKQKGKMKVTSDLYPMLAKEFKTSASRVERAIRHIVANRITLKQYASVGINKKPSNSELIYFFAQGGKE